MPGPDTQYSILTTDCDLCFFLAVFVRTFYNAAVFKNGGYDGN